MDITNKKKLRNMGCAESQDFLNLINPTQLVYLIFLLYLYLIVCGLNTFFFFYLEMYRL